ncbi:MAG: hypothetical protein EDX89_00355 [Acidobacteria bacterium]|nr:MAG: hypothetical protein EDX89_00355 [Acidobacteriota bacterium]
MSAAANTALRLVPVVLSCVVLGAHFLRSGHVGVAVLLAASPLVLLARRAPAVRAVQLLLLLGALEWVRTAAQIAGARRAVGAPWTRMALILGSVAAVALLGAALLQPLARRWARRGTPSPSPAEAA